jgi:hypothetical protein
MAWEPRQRTARLTMTIVLSLSLSLGLIGTASADIARESTSSNNWLAGRRMSAGTYGNAAERLTGALEVSPPHPTMRPPP